MALEAAAMEMEKVAAAMEMAAATEMAAVEAMEMAAVEVMAHLGRSIPSLIQSDTEEEPNALCNRNYRVSGMFPCRCRTFAPGSVVMVMVATATAAAEEAAAMETATVPSGHSTHSRSPRGRGHRPTARCSAERYDSDNALGHCRRAQAAMAAVMETVTVTVTVSHNKQCCFRRGRAHEPSGPARSATR